MTWLLVVLGGMVGAPIRYLVDVHVSARLGPWVPAGTLAANALGCLLLGLVAGIGLGAATPAATLLGPRVGRAPATNNTVAIETVRVAEVGRAGRAVAYAVVSPVVGLTALAAGLALA